MKKHIKLLTIGTLLLGGLTGCNDFLDREPLDKVIPEKYFASESEQMAMERYKEGNVSIVEVINAQLYHQQAQVNYIQSKLNAQMAKTDFERAIYYLREKE